MNAPFPASSPSDDVVHFDGPWTSDERRVVQAALGAVEHTGGLPIDDDADLPGKPWVCVRTERPARRFFAQRRGWPKVLRATSAEDLADVIRALPKQPPPKRAPSSPASDST